MSSEIDKRETQFTVAPKSDKAGPTAEEILLRAARRINFRENMYREMKSKGIMPKGVRATGESQDYLTGYDMVTAITQNAINAQFRKLWVEDIIPHQLDINIGKKKMSLVAETDTPTISLEVAGSHHRVIFMLPLNSGKFDHWAFDENGDPEIISTPIDKWVLAFEVNLGMEQIRQEYLRKGAEENTIPKAVFDSLTKFTDDNFNIDHLFLDLENADLANFDSARTKMPNLSITDEQQLKVLLGSYVSSLKGKTNPYICGYSVTTKDPSQTPNVTPIFRPTYCTYSTHQHQEAHPITGISTLNYLLMTDDRQGPTNPQAGIFNINLVESEDVYGSMVISSDLFKANYIEALVLDNIAEVLRNTIQDDYKSVPKLSFKQSGDGWDLFYETPHRTPVREDWQLGIDLNEKFIDKRISCHATISKGLSPVIKIKGSFYSGHEYWAYYGPIFGTARAHAYITQNWEMNINLTAGGDGKINVLVESSKLGETTIDKWIADWFKITDFFGTNIEKSTNDIASYYKKMQNQNFDQIKSAYANAFNKLQDLVILPAGKTFFYKDLQVNDEGDLLLHITYKD